MKTRECECCHEVLPVERFPLQGGVRHMNQCDAPYCQALAQAAKTAVNMAIIRTYWPLPLATGATITLAVILSPLLWWALIPLTAWTVWKLRSIQETSHRMFQRLPSRTKKRLEKLRCRHDIRNELIRANIPITPGIERYLSERWAYWQLCAEDQRTIDTADQCLEIPHWASMKNGMSSMTDDGNTCG